MKNKQYLITNASGSDNDAIYPAITKFKKEVKDVEFERGDAYDVHGNKLDYLCGIYSSRELTTNESEILWGFVREFDGE